MKNKDVEGEVVYVLVQTNSDGEQSLSVYKDSKVAYTNLLNSTLECLLTKGVESVELHNTTEEQKKEEGLMLFVETYGNGQIEGQSNQIITKFCFKK